MIWFHDPTTAKGTSLIAALAGDDQDPERFTGLHMSHRMGAPIA